MALDTLIKRFFPGIIIALIALVAYLQASGVVQLVAASALGSTDEDFTAGSLRPTKKSFVGSTRKPRSAAPLIAHNIFDHETDLNPKPPPPPPSTMESTASKGRLDLSDPLSADQCEGIGVQIITESSDPTWSIAVLKGPEDEKGSLRRVGDKIADFEIQYIGYNRLMGSPAVWMTKDTSLCQALLFAPEPPAEAEPKTPDVKQDRTPARPRRGGGLDKEIADKIEKVSDTEFNVDRAVVDNILENQATLMRSARIVPEKGADGKTVGIRLFGVRADTLLGTLGLQNGDRLETINGFEMASPEKALEAYARLRTANKLTIKITRRGKPTTLDFNIK